MYYVIKRQTHTPPSYFIGFRVPKFIVSKSSKNVIFEFSKDGKPDRRWVKKDEIVLLTKDKDYFDKVLNRFKDIESQQQSLVNEAKENLQKSMENFVETINAEIDEFHKLKHADDVPCVLKNL